MPVHVMRHALADETLARLRDRGTPVPAFRFLARRLSLLLVAEATRDLPVTAATVETPLEAAPVQRVTTRVVAVPVLRAGLGMLDAFLELVGNAEVGYCGLERNEETAVARRYYEKMPGRLGEAVVFLLDPMLATGGSALLAIEGLRGMGAKSVRLLSIVSAPEGIARVQAGAPEVAIYTAAVDRELNTRKYILPGLGDFGDRLYGT